MLQLRLKLIIVNLLLVADLGVGPLFLEVLFILDLVKDLDVGRYLLLPVLHLYVVAVRHGEAVPIIIDRLVLGIIVLLHVIILSLP